MTKLYLSVGPDDQRVEYRDKKRWWWLLSVAPRRSTHASRLVIVRS